MQTTPKKEIWLIRHGETAWTVSGQHTSFTDLPLTKRGRGQARSLARILKKIPFEGVFCSPLKRAFDTCYYAGLARRAVIDHDLVEWNYGAYEGLTSEEIRKGDPDWNIFSKDPPGGETRAEVEKRALRVLEKICGYEGRVALISSAHFSRALTTCFLSIPLLYGKYFFLSTASISRLGFDRGSPVILSWNNNSCNF